jgi:GxxExxY protein
VGGFHRRPLRNNTGKIGPVRQPQLFITPGLPYVAKCELKLTYKGRTLIRTYEPDFVCFGKIIVELKAVTELIPKHQAQLMNYLMVTGLRLGLLANFGSHPEVEIERRIV